MGKGIMQFRTVVSIRSQRLSWEIREGVWLGLFAKRFNPLPAVKLGDTASWAGLGWFWFQSAPSG